MKVGIGLPTTIPGVEPEQVLEWARRAEQAGFSSLGTLDRLVYPNYESLVSLAAVAAVTERIGLLTGVLLLPYRQNAALVAKQAATVHKLSHGRLTLGVGLGSREDDYEASGMSTTRARAAPRRDARPDHAPLGRREGRLRGRRRPGREPGPSGADHRRERGRGLPARGRNTETAG